MAGRPVRGGVVSWRLRSAWPVETIGTRFGGHYRDPCRCLHCRMISIFAKNASRACPMRSRSRCSAQSKSLLLSAGGSPTAMTGRRHRSNCELVAQGFRQTSASGAVRRYLRDRHDRAGRRPMVRVGRARPGLGACCILSFLLMFIIVAAPLAELYPARRPRRRWPCPWSPWKHGSRRPRSRHSSARSWATRWCFSSPSRWSSFRGPDRGHRRRLRAGLDSCSSTAMSKMIAVEGAC